MNKRQIASDNGIAIILVLWILVLLSLLAAEFTRSMRVEVQIAANFKDRAMAEYIARAGLEKAISTLIPKDTVPGKQIVDQKDDSQTDTDKLRINAENSIFSFADGTYEIRIDNESGKFNINRAPKQTLEMMLNRFNISEDRKTTIVSSILDWRDEDSYHRGNGAEDDYYLALPDPYECKDGEFDTIEELLLVRGISPDLFYGGLDKMITVCKDEDNPMWRLVSDVTIYATDEEKAYLNGRKEGKFFDFRRININYAPLPVLESLPGMTDNAITDILAYRKEKDFESVGDIHTLVGNEVYIRIYPFITLDKSSYYTITTKGSTTSGNTHYQIQAMVKIDNQERKGFRYVELKSGTYSGL